MKNEPALQVSWSSASSTMPLPARRASTAARTSAAGARSPTAMPSVAGQLGVADGRRQRAQTELEGHREHHVAAGPLAGGGCLNRELR